MKRKYILSAIVVLALIAGLAHFYGGSQTPPGQLPLQSLTLQNVADIKSEFNTAKDDVRVLVLLSPT